MVSKRQLGVYIHLLCTRMVTAPTWCSSYCSSLQCAVYPLMISGSPSQHTSWKVIENGYVRTEATFGLPGYHDTHDHKVGEAMSWEACLCFPFLQSKAWYWAANSSISSSMSHTMSPSNLNWGLFWDPIWDHTGDTFGGHTSDQHPEEVEGSNQPVIFHHTVLAT